MFDGDKFLTRGIASNIPVEIQMFIWSAIENMKSPDMDYLQVFDLFEENGLQIIHHTSEVPPFDMTYILPEVSKTVSAKIFVIDDYFADEDKHIATMLLAEEY